MSGKTPLWLTVIALYLLAGLTGCAKQASLTLKFTPQETTTYKVSTETIKDFRFEQLSLTPPKLKEEQSGTTVKAVFQQTIDKVQSDGSALATVTIKDIAYTVKDKNNIKFDFDSRREEDKNKPFAKIIGQSYRIRISPAGVVEVIDAKGPRSVLTGGYEARVAQSFFSDERIRKRHTILALPDIDKSTVKRGDSWSRIVASPPGLLSPKSFEKVYTVESVQGPKENPVVTVVMNATESAEPAPNVEKQPTGMGIFANMFDATETYTGKMVLEAGTGRILEYNEKLVATYLAAEEPADKSGDKGPDTLTMRLTQAVSMELVE